MANCRQACPYNTLYGCKVKEYYAICPLTNMTKPITEYKMTNADRIRAMSDEELAEWLTEFANEAFAAGAIRIGGALMTEHDRLTWLKQSAEEGER